MWTPDYDIIVETLTGSEFEVTVRETDTIGYLKYRIKKYEGIPVSQQHILFNQNELKDATVLKDIPLVRGSRLTLVLGMRGGPISARRVATDNWYDLSDVLNGTNRGQLTPIEPLTISTTGVKVLLYKDCKKNINRWMKLRKHHSLGTSGGSSSSGASSMVSNSFKGSSLSATASTASSAARQHLKVMDKNATSGEDSLGAMGEAQDQQWLLDNITTLKKMKQLRHSLDAKKKRKTRPGTASELTEELKKLQVTLEMNERLQKWLHRVASNATHLNDTDVASYLTSSSCPSNLATAATTTTSPSNTTGLGFDRVRRRPISMSGRLGITSSPCTAPTATSYVRGGVRKKDSSYQQSVEDYCSLAKNCDQNSLKDPFKGTAAEDRCSAAAKDEDAEETAERLKKRRESSQFEERLLTQFYDNSSPQCENFFRAFATTSAAEGAAILKETAAGAAAGGGSSSTAAAGGGERVSKFKWRFHSGSGNGDVSQGTSSRGADGEEGGLVSGTSPGATEADLFLNSLLMKRNNSSKIQKFTSSSSGFEYGGGARRWSERVSATDATPAKKERDLAQEWRDMLKECVDAVEVDHEKDVLVVREASGGQKGLEVETVIIEKAEQGEEELLRAACGEILNDPEAFDDADEDEEEEEEETRNELIDLMAFDSSGEDTEEELSAVLKRSGLSGGDEDDDEDEEDEEPESCLGHVLVYEDEERGEVAFLGAGGVDEEDVPSSSSNREGRDTGIRKISTREERVAYPGFLQFDESYDEDEEDEDEEEESNEPVKEEKEEQRISKLSLSCKAQTAEKDHSDDEVEVELSCNDADALEFDDFAYFPSTTADPVPFLKESPVTARDALNEKSFLPKVVVESRTKDKERNLDQIGGERLVGPSLPEIINRGAERRRERTSMFGEGEENSLSPTQLKRDRDEHRERSGKLKTDQVQLPDIKLLESDLKMMGLDVILNDSDDSFERAIKRHFRNESKAAVASTTTSANMFKANGVGGGESLLRSGREETKKLKQGDLSSDWLIQFDVDLESATKAANDLNEEQEKQKKKSSDRCAKCNKKLGIIMIMQCHCGLFFCSRHRYAEAHDCAYDFKGNGKQILAKENPLVVGEKLPKI